MALAAIILILQCTGCSSAITYEPAENLSAYVDTIQTAEPLTGYAADLCVTEGDTMPAGELEHVPEVAGLFNVTDKQVLYAKNIFQQVEPASITKLLTALVALKYGNLDDQVSVSRNVIITEYGAKLCGFWPGDVITLRDAMYGLLVYSGNDAGVVIAEHISGSVEAFAELMNKEAQAIGATHTHFVNPHGLTAEGHVTTAYDLYLIFSELLQYPEFLEIIQTRQYICKPNTCTAAPTETPSPDSSDAQYMIVDESGDYATDFSDGASEAPVEDVTASDAPDSAAQSAASDVPTTEAPVDSSDSTPPHAAAGVPTTEAPADVSDASDTDVSIIDPVRELIWNNTNYFFSGKATAPAGITVLGGKTGTTAAAGNCLILLSSDTNNKQYISVVMHAPNKTELYAEMIDLLQQISK